jgi:hypothetical protein
MTIVTKTLQPIAAIARMIREPTFAPIAPNDNVPTAQMMTPPIAIAPAPSTATIDGPLEIPSPCAELNDHRGWKREGKSGNLSKKPAVGMEEFAQRQGPASNERCADKN